MPLPAFTYPVNGPIIMTASDLPPANAALRDAGVVAIFEGKLQRVNSAGDAWVDVPGWVISATEPSDPFDGMGWYDTSTDSMFIFTMALSSSRLASR